MNTRSRPYIETIGETRSLRILTGKHLNQFIKTLVDLTLTGEQCRERGWRRKALRALSAQCAPDFNHINQVGNNLVFAFAPNLAGYYDWSECSDTPTPFPLDWFDNPNWCYPALEDEVGYPLEGREAAGLMLSEHNWIAVGHALSAINHVCKQVPKAQTKTAGDVEDTQIRVLVEPYRTQVYMEGGDSVEVCLPVIFVMINKKTLSDHSDISNRQLMWFVDYLVELGACFKTELNYGTDLIPPNSVERSREYAECDNASLKYLFGADYERHSGDKNIYATWHVVEHDLTSHA